MGCAGRPPRLRGAVSTHMEFMEQTVAAIRQSALRGQPSAGATGSASAKLRLGRSARPPEGRDQPMRTKGPELETVIRGLHSSKIRVGFQTFSGGIAVWISDELYLVREDCVIDPAHQITIEISVARWVRTTTLRLFPDRDYALGRHRTHDSAYAATNA